VRLFGSDELEIISALQPTAPSYQNRIGAAACHPILFPVMEFKTLLDVVIAEKMLNFRARQRNL